MEPRDLGILFEIAGECSTLIVFRFLIEPYVGLRRDGEWARPFASGAAYSRRALGT